MSTSLSSDLRALRDLQAQQSARFAATGEPLAFGDDRASWQAAHTQVALCDRSPAGLIEVGDRDRLRFLHNQTTNDMEGLAPGSGCETVFVTSTARTLDVVTAYITDETALLLTSPGQAQPLIEWMDKYIFFADRVSLTNLTPTTACFSLVGPESHALLTAMTSTPLPTTAHHHVMTQLGDHPVRIAAGCGLALPGYTLLVDAAHAAPVWQQLSVAGSVLTGTTGWEQLRITQGRPIPSTELNDTVNPLEAGLWHAVSFEKGCYIGQETIARLQTYQGVKQQLWGLEMAERPAVTTLQLDGQAVGEITSLVETPLGVRGLGYVRTKAGSVGLTLQAGDTPVTVLDPPYLTHGYLTPA